MKNIRISKLVKAIIFGFVINIVISVLLLSMMSLAVYKIGVPTSFLQYISVFCCGVGSFFGACVAGYITEESGLAIGAIMGVVMLAVLFLLNIFTNDMTLGTSTFIKYIVILLISILGAIFGVNKSNSTIKQRY